MKANIFVSGMAMCYLVLAVEARTLRELFEESQIAARQNYASSAVAVSPLASSSYGGSSSSYGSVVATTAATTKAASYGGSSSYGSSPASPSASSSYGGSSSYYGSVVATTAATTKAVSYGGSYSSSPSSSSYGSSSTSGSSSGGASVALPSQLVYVWGYAPPPPSQGNGGPYMLYQGLAPGMVVVPVNQLNQMFAAGASPLPPVLDSASQYFVPSSSSLPNAVSSPSSSSSSSSYGRR